VILPPLPPVAAHWRPAGPDMLDLLAASHRRLLAVATVADVVGHLSAEEQYLYPVVRATLTDGDRLADAEVAADAAIRSLLRDGRDAGEALRGHVARCEALFPALRAGLDEVTRIRLGNRLVVAQEAAPTRPHRGTPTRPPWNRLVDPLVGAVDKIRDTFSGYPDRAHSKR
jgi:hypothetical protein